MPRAGVISDVRLKLVTLTDDTCNTKGASQRHCYLTESTSAMKQSRQSAINVNRVNKLQVTWTKPNWRWPTDRRARLAADNARDVSAAAAAR
jgi:hypothetical protein